MVSLSQRILAQYFDFALLCPCRGLAPHCLAILKTCHHLTEKLVGMTMGNTQELRNPELLTDIVSIAKRISPRVDEVVLTLYPPLDPRLLEARYVHPPLDPALDPTQLCINSKQANGPEKRNGREDTKTGENQVRVPVLANHGTQESEVDPKRSVSQIGELHFLW